MFKDFASQLNGRGCKVIGLAIHIGDNSENNKINVISDFFIISVIEEESGLRDDWVFISFQNCRTKFMVVPPCRICSGGRGLMESRSDLLRLVSCRKVLALPATVAVFTGFTFTFARRRFPFSFRNHTNGRGVAIGCSMPIPITGFTPWAVIGGRWSSSAIGIFEAPVGGMAVLLMNVAP
jgi:hypothetical protein